MQVLVFSDTHLTARYDQAKANFLKHIIEPAEQVIIAGDFWDSHKISFDMFVTSPWQELFPMLKERKTVYVFGNHDPRSLMDSRINLFSDVQDMQYLFPWQDKEIVILHGHRLDPIFGKEEESLILKIIGKVYNPLEEFGVRLIGQRFSKLLPDKLVINQILKYRSRNDQNRIYVTGHSHYPVFDLNKGFINLGYIAYGVGSYLSIDDQGLRLEYGRY